MRPGNEGRKALLPVYGFAGAQRKVPRRQRGNPRWDRALVITEWAVVVQLEQSRDETGVVGWGEGRSRERLVERSHEEVAEYRRFGGLP